MAIARDEIRRLNRIGEILVDRGVIDQELLENAILIQSMESGQRRKLGEILVEDLGCDRHKIYRELARIFAFPEINLEVVEFTKEKIEYIKTFYESVDKKNRNKLFDNNILPYEIDDKRRDTLIVLTDDPTDREKLLLAKKLGFRHIELAYARQELLSEWIQRICESSANEFLEVLRETYGSVDSIDDEDEGIDEEALDQEINRSLLTNLIEGCLIEGVRQEASDIHVVPAADNKVDFLFRVDGKLQHWHTQEFIKPEAVAAVVKDRSRNVDRFERAMAQDGFIQREIDKHIIRFRVSIIPIISSEYRRKLESIAIRVLDDRKVIADLEELGFHEPAKKYFTRAITKPQGMVILTGPTGSGKSTTLIAALHQVITPEKNVLTVEDPVEYMIRGARQIKLSHTLDFEAALRSILRHDPDIVMVGEMRDKQTADIAIKLANTGHLTFTTLHTNDAPSVLSRLFKMGIEPFLIAYAINIVVAQRLIRTLCPLCKVEDRNLDREVPLSIGFTEEEADNITFYKAVGCKKCNDGFKGRTAIHEALYFTKEIRRLVLESGEKIDEDAVRNIAIKNGMFTLRAAGRERIKAGITTCEEIGFATAEE